MFIGQINDRGNLFDLHPYFKSAFDWIDNHMNDIPPKGKYNIEGEMFAIVDEYSTRPITGAEFENHQKYIDIQILVEGEEWIFWTIPDEARFPKSTPYSQENDIEFFSIAEKVSPSQLTTLFMKTGLFAIFFPGDWHMPCITPNNDQNPRPIKKVVIKVPIL